MANRCVRCQKEDVTLETFGVFRCPACGRVDADGNPLDAAVASQQPFDAPPPWTPPDIAEQARAALVGAETRGPPTWFFGALLVSAIITLASAVSPGARAPAVLQVGMLAALASGRPWARLLAIAGSALSIVAVCVALAVLRAYLPPSATPALAVSALSDAAWIYVLFREDTVRYFARA